MEYVSLLAGYPFSDAPPCTHPLVAQIARVTNDVSSAAARGRLIGMAPELAAASGADPRVPPAIVQLAVGAALDAAPRGALWPRRARRLHACTQRTQQRLAWLDRPHGGPRPRWRAADLAYRYVAARCFREALDILVHLPQPERDVALLRLLRDALVVCSGHPGPVGEAVGEAAGEAAEGEARRGREHPAAVGADVPAVPTLP